MPEPRVLPEPPGPGAKPRLPGGHPPIPFGRGRETASLDELFARLKRAPSDDVASFNRQKIELKWLESGSDTVDLLMSRALMALQADNKSLALDLLDAILILKPDFAEAHNRRATVYFMNKDFGRSIAEVETVLRLEPRHFGALVGLAGMLKELDRKKEALAVYRRALDLDPRLPNAAKEAAELATEVEGREL
ncbi:tetratricopeptide repeat protein [Methyloraptor flagellatus]|uniref:Tetratricopeptide repeat protein n=1 Tax=Methyloraptor flagellatus TaxID=3162530 RepID=A0AAU7X9K0_9HYPH